MEDLEKYLLTKEDSGLSASELRHMGKQAAVRYVQNETPLNDSIAELAKEGGLNLEQIKRVSEYANNDTFATMFKLGFAKNITFPMADATAVSQLIHAPKEKTASANRPSIPTRMKYVPGQEGVDLETIFTGQGIEKTANAGKVKALIASGLSPTEAVKKAYPDYTPEQVAEAVRMFSSEKNASIEPLIDPSIRDATRQFLDLHTENKNSSADKEALGDVFQVKIAALKDLCKEASRSGNSAGIIGYAIESANPGKGLLEVISDNIGELIEFGHGGELEKLGMGMMMGNPITGLTQELEGVSQKLVMAQQAVAKTQLAMQELLSILRGPDMSTPAAQLFGGGPPIPAGPPAGPTAGPPPVGPEQPPGPMGAAPAPQGPPMPQGPGAM
tara:strand:- start:3773 stop:4933 length:1161 start_codon:yes stop_codon:yes gene_type:complete